MHRHQYVGRKLKREAGHRNLMLRNLSTSLVLHEKIKTTLAKAKELRPTIENLITKAKKGDLSARRSLSSYLLDKNAVEKIISEIAPIHKERKGGYTRIIKIADRKGDGAKMAFIEILDMSKAAKKIEKSPEGKNKKTTEVKAKSAKKTKKEIKK